LVYVEVAIHKIELGQAQQETLLMNSPLTADDEPLLNGTNSALKNTTVSTLQSFCSKYRLVVAASGKRNQSIKEDYVASILIYVSVFVKVDIECTN
jgi:hypothetical protein